jgi:hypothetical protein
MKLNIHEFFDETFMLIDEKVFSNMYIDQNIGYFKEVNLFLYEEYEKDALTLHLAARLLEKFVIANFRHLPGQVNILEDDYNNTD